MPLFGRSMPATGSVLALVVAWLALVTRTIAHGRDDMQLPLLSPNHKDADEPSFSVGFSIQSSYGAATVLVEEPNGDGMQKHNFISHGNEDYRQALAKLSLVSSQHIAPPYNDMGEYFEDQPRRMAREGLLKVGMAPSREVGAIAGVIKDLRKQIETKLGLTVSEAVFATSHLVALYQDDLTDLAKHLGITYVTPHRQYRPLLWETGAAWGGYGNGWCEHWWDKKKCLDETAKMVDVHVLAVHYSRCALTVSLAKVFDPVGLWEPDHVHDENFTLGRDAIDSYDHVDSYWSDVSDLLTYTMRFFPNFNRPSRVMVTGDEADDKFLSVVRETLTDYLGTLPEIMTDKSVSAAAEGAAELMRRSKAPW